MATHRVRVLTAVCGAAVGVAVGAGVLGASARADEPLLAGDEYQPARLAGHVYVNARTGERVMTGPGGPGVSRLSDLYWENEDVAGSCNFFVGIDRPTRDTTLGRVKFGAAAVCWGDVPAGSLVDGYEVAYATNIGGFTASGVGSVAGLDMINMFLDDYDGTVAPGGVGATVIHALRLEDIAGSLPSDPAPWIPFRIYTVDLEGSGLEFGFGSNDLDGDGLHDFAYTYEWVQGQTEESKGIIGPMLVRPFSLDGQGTATGCIDGYDWFNQLGGTSTLTNYVGTFWFGGGDCPTTPYASFFLNLYGQMGEQGCPRIDYAPDGLVDFADYLEFLNHYERRDIEADLNVDGLIDFADYLEFLNLYEACRA